MVRAKYEKSSESRRKFKKYSTIDQFISVSVRRQKFCWSLFLNSETTFCYQDATSVLIKILNLRTSHECMMKFCLEITRQEFYLRNVYKKICEENFVEDDQIMEKMMIQRLFTYLVRYIFCLHI